MALNEMDWSGRWYRSLAVVAWAADRAIQAGGFDATQTEFELFWEGQDRRYRAYDGELIGDTRSYGFPARTLVTMRSARPYEGEVRILADANRYDGAPPPALRVSARGIVEERVRAAFEAARDTLADPSLSRLSDYDVRELLAAEAASSQEAPELEASRQRSPVAGYLRRGVDAVEAHPAVVALVGVVVSTLVALIVR